MEEWKEYKLGDITSLVIDYRGKTPLKLRGNWSSSGYRALSAKNIKTGEIVNKESIRFVDENLYKKWMKDEVQRGDIFITSEAPFGQIYYWNSDEKIVLSQRLFCIRITKNVNSKFVYYFMTTNGFQHELDGRATGTTVVGLRQPELLKCHIKLPSIEEQNIIADILSTLDEKIECNKRINDNLEQQAQALFKSWFVDFEPFKDGEFVESKLGMIPKGWRVERIEDLSQKMASGGTPKSLNKDYYSGDIKWFSTKELKDCFLFDSEKHISEEALKSSSAKMFPEGTVLMAIYAAPTVGRLGILTISATFNQAAVGIVPKKNVGSEFVFLSLLSERTNLNNLASGAAQQNLNVGIVKNYNLIVPDDNTLERFNNIARDIFNITKEKAAESRRLAQLRDTLLPRLMSGELKVNEIENIK